ncbi:hypothetical protein [Vagococcus xieshaowenii]|uniref:Uncharacterized protein n=1 Tax=Vagococcus xieshaowenii TaxID=2562451 RepID=A0AAJ5EHF3_9ENTE|nr:hypothetical protein [Vagococcus xieshaowenii]QCA28978.1 hypothetical protein E4Z98_06470 [Vagococcus xieshaowenii]TFZ43158.1 hypothetical protein E4031_00895 [Vagococcus xieshaowenii]
MKNKSPKSVFDIISTGAKIPTLLDVRLAINTGKWLNSIINGLPDGIDIYSNQTQQRLPDFALVAGILLLDETNPTIKDAFKLAYEKKIDVGFINQLSVENRADYSIIRLIKDKQTYLINYQLHENSVTIHTINESVMNVVITA